MPSEKIDISLAIPVYNEEASLPALFRRLDLVLENVLSRYGNCEVVLVNDGSSDQSWHLIEECCARDVRYVGINLSRNFGHQLAMTAALENARGEVVVTLDADLQDPPEVIAEMVDAYRRGYDVVYATRRVRGKENAFKRCSAGWFYKIMTWISRPEIPENTGDFRLLSRRVLVELQQMRETHRFLRGLVPWIGFPQTQIFYDRDSRAAGTTHYPWHSMVLLAFDGIASMSTAPLRLAYGLAVLLFLVFLGYVGYVAVCHLGFGTPLVPGWTSLMCSITIFGTMQLVLLGIMGEYLGRIYEQVKQRPLYIISDIRRKADKA